MDPLRRPINANVFRYMRRPLPSSSLDGVIHFGVLGTSRLMYRTSWVGGSVKWTNSKRYALCDLVHRTACLYRRPFGISHSVEKSREKSAEALVGRYSIMQAYSKCPINRRNNSRHQFVPGWNTGGVDGDGTFRALIFSETKFGVLVIPGTPGDDAQTPSLKWWTFAEAAQLGLVVDPIQEVYLGEWARDDYSWQCFAVLVTHDAVTSATMNTAGSGSPSHEILRVMDVRSIAAMIPVEDSGVLAYARSVLEWHTRHRFCGSCGSETRSELGGSRRRCIRNLSSDAISSVSGCQGMWFPRTDPVIIVVCVEAGTDRALLGRSPAWPPGLFSALAGFMEHGETIEGAVAREVEEEAGVVPSDVRYFASQPWPFPYSLMIACFAMVDGAENTLCPDKDEIEEVRWFSRAEVTEMIRSSESTKSDGSSLRVPPPLAIAHHLCLAFAKGEPISRFGNSAAKM